MAKRFRFRLETLRRIRQQERDRQQRTLANAVRNVESAGRRLATIAQQVEDAAVLTRFDRQRERLDLASIRATHLYRGFLEQQLVQERIALGRTTADLDAHRAKLGEATKNLKVLENLRDRQWRRHRVEVARQEQAEYDEVGAQQYARKPAENPQEHQT